MTAKQEEKLSEVHECVVELRTELRSRGGLRDRVEQLEEGQAKLREGHFEHRAIVIRGLTIIGTITTIAAFAGSTTGAKVLLRLLGQ